MVALAVLCGLLLAALVYVIVNSRRERETMLRAVNLSITEGTKERVAHRAQVSELLTRIQAPEVASTLSSPEPTGETLHVPDEDDQAHDEYLEARAAGEVA